jgi:hypothetical protein
MRRSRRTGRTARFLNELRDRDLQVIKTFLDRSRELTTEHAETLADDAARHRPVPET